MERESYNLRDMEPVMRKVLAEDGVFPFYPKGTSMEPTIHQGTDQVLLKALPEKLKKYQMVLYKRSNGAFVLHRIVRIEKDSYTMRGDNQFFDEPGIRREQMIGIVCGLQTPKGEVDTENFLHLVKSALWVESAGIRKILRGLRRHISKIIRLIRE